MPRIKTLKDVWASMGLAPTWVAAQAGISVQTLYRMNRKEESVSLKTIMRVCEVLKITYEDYRNLEAGGEEAGG